MLNEWGTIIIGILGSGGLTAILTLWMNHSKGRREERAKEIDERIDTWKRMAEKSERRQNFQDEFNRNLLDHISKLEVIIARLAPNIEIPEKPKLRMGDE